MLKRTWFARAALAAVATALLGAPAPAAVIFDDNFDGYADTAALDAVWGKGGTHTDAQTFLDNGPAGSANTSKAVHHTARAYRVRFSDGVAPTAADPLVVEYDLYDAAGSTDTAANEYNQALAKNAAGALTQLVAMGKSSLVPAGSGGTDFSKYQARIAFGSVNWFNLNAARSVGWHTFTAEIFPDTINFYVDGVLDSTKTFTGGVGDAFSEFRIGPAGLSARAEEAYYDNFSVTTGVVPEPAAVGLACLAGFGLLARRRRA